MTHGLPYSEDPMIVSPVTNHRDIVHRVRWLILALSCY